MSSAALQIAPPDYESLLGYETAITARNQNGAIFIAPDIDTFNAMESQGLPALFPRDGKWLMGHAALVEGMDLIFVFSTLAYRVEVGRIVAGYARGLFILSDESIGHNDTISFLQANDLCLDGLLGHAAHAAHYEYEQEAAIFNTITPLKSARKPQAEYPLEALGPIMGPIAKSIVSNIQVSTPLAAQSVLAVASLTAQQYADVQPPYYGAKLIPCMNYFLTIAGSGERKSAANNAA